MCYLVTGEGLEAVLGGKREPHAYENLPDARKYAEHLALKGVKDVRIWLLTHSVTVQPQAVWTDHAKGLTGNHKE